MRLRRFSCFVLIGLCVSTAGCRQHTTPLHSVRAVKDAFARHALKLAEVERTRTSTWLIPAPLARDWRATPALARLPRLRANDRYFVIVVTDRRWLNDLSGHVRAAERTLGIGRVDWSQTSTRRDNVLIAYPTGAPKSLGRLKRILDDL